MAHDIRVSARVRLIRWRARKRAEAKAAKAADRDAKRVAKGLLPLKEANVVKQAAWRARQAALREIIRTSWFAPSLTDAEFAQYAAANGWDDARARQRKESFESAARIAALNVNRFVLENYCQKAVDQRVHFSELVDAGASIPDAIEQARTARFVPKGAPGSIAAILDTENRYETAKWTWFGREDEIVAAVLGKVTPSK